MGLGESRGNGCLHGEVSGASKSAGKTPSPVVNACSSPLALIPHWGQKNPSFFRPLLHVRLYKERDFCPFCSLVQSSTRHIQHSQTIDLLNFRKTHETVYIKISTSTYLTLNRLFSTNSFTLQFAYKSSRSNINILDFIHPLQPTDSTLMHGNSYHLRFHHLPDTDKELAACRERPEHWRQAAWVQIPVPPLTNVLNSPENSDPEPHLRPA